MSIYFNKDKKVFKVFETIKMNLKKYKNDTFSSH